MSTERSKRSGEQGVFFIIVGLVALPALFMILMLVRDSTRPRLAERELQTKLDSICRTVARNSVLQRVGVQRFAEMVDSVDAGGLLRYATIRSAYLVMPTMSRTMGDFNLAGTGATYVPGGGSSVLQPWGDVQPIPFQYLRSLPSLNMGSLGCSKCFFFSDADKASTVYPQNFTPGMPIYDPSYPRTHLTQPFPARIWDNGSGAGSVVGCGITAEVNSFTLGSVYVTAKTAFRRSVAGNVTTDGDGKPLYKSTGSPQDITGLTVAVGTEMLTNAHDRRFWFGTAYETGSRGSTTLRQQIDPELLLTRPVAGVPGVATGADLFFNTEMNEFFRGRSAVFKNNPAFPYLRAFCDRMEFPRTLSPGSPIFKHTDPTSTLNSSDVVSLPTDPFTGLPMPAGSPYRIDTIPKMWVACLGFQDDQYHLDGIADLDKEGAFDPFHRYRGDEFLQVLGARVPWPGYRGLLTTIIANWRYDQFAFQPRNPPAGPPPESGPLSRYTFGAGSSPTGLVMSDRDELLMACSNPATLVRNAFLQTIVELASRHGELRRATEILHVNPQNQPTQHLASGATTGLALSAAIPNAPVLITEIGDDLAARNFELPYVTYYSDSWTKPGGKYPDFLNVPGGGSRGSAGGWVSGANMARLGGPGFEFPRMYRNDDCDHKPREGDESDRDSKLDWEEDADWKGCIDPSFSHRHHIDASEEFDGFTNFSTPIWTNPLLMEPDPVRQDRMLRAKLMYGAQRRITVATSSHHRLINEQLRMCFHLYADRWQNGYLAAFDNQAMRETLRNDNFEPNAFRKPPFGQSAIRLANGIGNWAASPYFGQAASWGPTTPPDTRLTAGEVVSMLGTTQVCPYYQQFSEAVGLQEIEQTQAFYNIFGSFVPWLPRPHLKGYKDGQRTNGFLRGTFFPTYGGTPQIDSTIAGTPPATARFCSKPGAQGLVGDALADKELRPDVLGLVHYWKQTAPLGTVQVQHAARSPGLWDMVPVSNAPEERLPWGGAASPNYTMRPGSPNSQLLYVTHKPLFKAEVDYIKDRLANNQNQVTVVFIPTTREESVQYKSLMEAFNAKVDPNRSQQPAENLFVFLSPFQPQFGFDPDTAMPLAGTPAFTGDESDIFSKYWRYLLLDEDENEPAYDDPNQQAQRTLVDETVVSVARSVFHDWILTYKLIL